MKNAFKRLIGAMSLLIMSATSLAGCSILKSLEKSIDVTFVGGDPFTTAHVTTFSNGLTPGYGGTVTIDEKLFGWTPLDEVHYSDPNFDKEYVPHNGIVRYDDIKDYAVDGKVTLKPCIINRSEIPHYYLVVGWYAKTATSGLDQKRIDKWTVDLKNFLQTDVGATDEEINNIAIRAYNGDVASMGGKINADGDVDVLVGVGNNINSTGNVSIKEKQGNIPMGGITRYIARLTDFPVSISVYEWLKTEAGYASLA